MPQKHNFCIVVPAFNEERVITRSLLVLRKIISPAHIYVVSDGSRDLTVAGAQIVTDNVLALRKNVGKANAIAKLVKKYKLTKRYKYILLSDADSQLKLNFLKQMAKHLPSQPACMVGKVNSERHSVISAYRAYEYGLSNLVYRQAQHIMHTIAIAPGCASAYRSDVFEQLDLTHHTLTEDFDFTLQIHNKKLGKIIFVPEAQVVTQDPFNLGDYWNQITRWNTGFWQNVYLHKMLKLTSRISWEIFLMVLDSVFFVAVAVVAFLYWSFLLHLLIGSLVFFVTAAFLVLLIEKQIWAARYIPIFSLFQLLNLCSYFYSFFRVTFGRNRLLAWNKVARY